jgi:GNAT superfamily N-acetyltransferase
MRFKSFNVTALDSYINSVEFGKDNVIPISRQRAISHFNNPQVTDSDVIMIMAFDDTKLVGYLGIVPGKINVGNQEHKVGWLSCLWIDANERGKGIAKKLVEQALSGWNNKIIATEFTKEAKALYDKIGLFEDLKISVGIRGYLRFELHTFLPARKKLFARIKGLLKLADGLLNAINDIRIDLWRRNRKRGNIIEYITRIDEEASGWISDLGKNEIFKKETEHFNWILHYPWILSAPFPDRESKKYHFSSLALRFEFICLKIYDLNQIIGFILLSVRDKHMKIPYLYVASRHLPLIAEIIFDHMIEMKINTITIFNPPLVEYMQNGRTPLIHCRKMKRHYIHSGIFNNPDEKAGDTYVIQDGDGDCAFT